MKKKGDRKSWALSILSAMTHLSICLRTCCYCRLAYEPRDRRSNVDRTLLDLVTRAKEPAQRFEFNMADEPETCDLCSSTGPPVRPSSISTDSPDAAADLEWIACSKCDKWLHSVCVVKSPEHFDITIPSELKEQISSMGEAGPWFDWTDPVSKW